MVRAACLVIAASLPFGAPAWAQPELEIQGGAGYVYDSREGPSSPAINAAMTVWLTTHTGIGVRFVKGLTDDHYDPPIVDDDRTWLGPGGLRMWSGMLQVRGHKGRAEFNFGIGFGAHSSNDEVILTGIRRADGTIDPITPELHRLRYPTGFIALEMLTGIRLGGPFHLKGGFTYLVPFDIQPFQPMIVLAIKPRQSDPSASWRRNDQKGIAWRRGVVAVRYR